MNVMEIVMIGVGVCTILGSVVSVVYVITHKVSYAYADATYQRKDLHSQEYNTLLEKIEELRKAIEDIKSN